MKSVITYKKFQVLILIITISVNVGAQKDLDAKSHLDLYNEIYLHDSLLFAAFNSRDITTFKNYFNEDLEFYHDIGGLTNYQHTVNFLIEISKKNNQLKRELVPGSLQVYPIPGYGAMEIGSHRFCHIENGKEECGTFEFVQIWQKKEGKWKITRVISYGH